MPTINFNTRASRYTYSSHLNDSFFVCSQNKPSRRILGVARAAWIRFLDHVIGLNPQRSIRNRFDIATIVSRYEGLAHEQLILKVTDDCNFRCSYCVYGGGYQGRERQTGKNMTIETAIEAVDKFLANHAPEHNISFYGGEPLLRLDLIKEVVEYARRNSPQGATPRFSLTSNGSLIDAETARFLLENRFSLTLSLDGPSTIHDRERKDAKGQPTHKSILDSIVLLHSMDRAFKNLKLRISTVCVSEEDVKTVHSYFSSHPILSNLQFAFAFPIPGASSPQFFEHNAMITKDIHVEYAQGTQSPLKSLEQTFVDGLMRGKHDHFLSALFESFYQDYFIRHLRAKDSLQLLGCCDPGIRRLLVSPDGLLYPCEKLDSSLPIGTVKEWIDMSLVCNLHESMNKLTELCHRCWAVKICKMCFASFFDGKSLSNELKTNVCDDYKATLLCMLKGYHELYEADSKAPRRHFSPDQMQI